MVPDGEFFSVLPEELDQLQLSGALYGKTEVISFRVRDAAGISEIANITATTIPNANDPTVQAVNTSLRLGETVGVTELFTFSDLDTNTLKRVGFRDRGLNTSSGSFLVNGVAQPAGEFFWVDAADLGTVEFASGTDFSLEQFEVQAFDGQRLSCLLYTSPSPRDATLSRMPSSA